MILNWKRLDRCVQISPRLTFSVVLAIRTCYWPVNKTFCFKLRWYDSTLANYLIHRQLM